jgi:hypothetical protein
MSKRALDPKDFTKGSFKKVGSVREPLLISGTLACGGKEAGDFTRLHAPCLVQGTLNAERTHFDAGLQVQGHAFLEECKVGGPSGFAGQVQCKDSAFKDQITMVQGSKLLLQKTRAQDIRIEAAPWRWRWMSFLSRWIGRAKITLEDSSVHHIATTGNAYALVILKGSSKILGRTSEHVLVVDRRTRAVRQAEARKA